MARAMLISADEVGTHGSGPINSDTEVEMASFAEARAAFDTTLGRSVTLARSLVPVHGEIKSAIRIRANGDRRPFEEYYKWQFIYALIHSGLCAKDFIGAEVYFPKGTSQLRIDAAIFDDPDWIEHYRAYWDRRDATDLQWLNDHLLAVVEFKRDADTREIEQVFSRQIKPAMKEKEPSDSYILGAYYDYGRLFLFHRRDAKYLRYDEQKNQKGVESGIQDLSLHLPDPYFYFPSFHDLRNRVHSTNRIDRSVRGIADLEVITSIATVQLQSALSAVLRALDKHGLVNQRGYQILIETFALKIFDEKRNQKTPRKKLEFYALDAEVGFNKLSEQPIRQLIERLKGIWEEAEGQYRKILSGKQIQWNNENHVRAVAAVCAAFQDFSFVRSSKSDLYQLVFYNFANSFKRDESAQFLTPLPVIDFLVQLVNPRNSEVILDPCCGIADFLSLSFVHSQTKSADWKLDDANIYGVDLDENMIMLATLNMLLNGDGEAKLFHKTDKGSILSKVATGDPPYLVELIRDRHKAGNWDDWPDGTKLMKFDAVLTNPPFGEDRAFRPASAADRKMIECYETWKLAGGENGIDLGVIFLENAYRCLKEGGRLGIVVSNSIASINGYKDVRQWLMDRMRIVALFDLPANVFAETGVNTSLIVAYKPTPRALARLNEDGYSVFVRDIQSVGYEKRTKKRNVVFNPLYRIDPADFQIQTDGEGKPILDEDFTRAVADFREWALGQEDELQRAFLREE